MPKEIIESEVIEDFDTKLRKLIHQQSKLLEVMDDYQEKRKELTLKEITELATATSKLSSSISSTMFKQKEMEYKEKIDFHNPKIQRAFGFLLESVIESMHENGINEMEINNTIDRLSFKLIGFEDRLNSTLKNINMNMVDKSTNPLVKQALSN